MVYPGETPVDFEALTFLLKANSKDQLRNLFCEAFDRRRDAAWPTSGAAQAVLDSLSLDSLDESRRLLIAIHLLVKLALYRSGDLVRGSAPGEDPKATAQRIAELFPADFNRKLRDLVVKLLAEFLPGWRRRAIEDRVGLPRLADFRWRVDAKTASDTVDRIGIPTCFVQLSVERGRCGDGGDGAKEVVNVEFTQEQMNNLVGGLKKIKNQLESVTKK